MGQERLAARVDTLQKCLARYADGTRLVWVQEEPQNMGGWYFINSNLERIIGTRLPLSLVSRPAAASPATGSKASHDLEQQRVIGVGQLGERFGVVEVQAEPLE